MNTIGTSMVMPAVRKDLAVGGAAGTPDSGPAGTGSAAGTAGTGTTGGTGTSGASGTGTAGAGKTGTSDTDTVISADAAAAQKITSSATQDRFLKLLIAQMKNQDPMNPLDNAAVTSQMAQISTVEGIEKLNSTMSKFATANGMGRAANATGLIGQTVLAPGSQLTWDATTTAMRGGVSLDGPASKLVVELFDAAGRVVDRRQFTDQAAGTIGIDWTGRNPDGGRYGAGTYVMRATVMSDAGATARTLTTDRVTGVMDSADGVMAQLAGGQQVPVSKINGVFQAPAPSTAAQTPATAPTPTAAPAPAAAPSATPSSTTPKG